MKLKKEKQKKNMIVFRYGRGGGLLWIKGIVQLEIGINGKVGELRENMI